MPQKPIKKPRKNFGTNLNYWKHLLDDFSLASKLWLEGFDIAPIPSGVTPEHRYETKIFSLSFNPKDLTETTLQAAWAILLNRYSGADDIVYGMAYLNITNHEENIATTSPPLPVRAHLHDEDSIQFYIKELKTQIQNNIKYSESYFNDSDLKEQFTTLISYLFITQSDKETHKEALITTITPEHYSLVFIADPKNPTKIKIYYDTIRFTQASIKNIALHYELILNQVINNPKKQVAHFNLLTDDEKIKLGQWNKPIDNDILENQKYCCHELFINQATKNPSNIAVTDENNELNYQQLNELSNQLAHFLIKKNVQVGDCVVVLTERTPAIVVALLAVFKTGAIYVPISPKYPDERIQYVLSDCNPSIILANNTDRIPEEHHSKVELLNDSYALINSYSKEKITRQFSSEEIAYIIYTSGTTGQPKGVMIKHASLTNLSLYYKHYLNITANDRASQFASSGFDTFFCETVPYLTLGASIHMIDDHAKLTPSILIPWLVQQKITIGDLPTSYAQVILSMPLPDSLSLRALKVGGESLTHYPPQMLTFDMWNIYGPTEATIECTFNKFYIANSPIESFKDQHFPPSIGKPIVNSEVYVVDQHFEPVPIGNVGELLIGGTVISSGYLNRKQLTREKFIRNLYSSDPHAKLYRTGDLVRWLEDGSLEFIGRIDNQVKIRGYRIELSEIETTIRKYPDVAEVVVLAKEIVNGQKTLIAYLVPNLDKLRIPYHEKCLINLNDIHFLEVISDDISKEGIAITGLNDKIEPGTPLRINFKLPGTSDGQWLSGKVMWQVDQRAGIEFDKSPREMSAMNKCIEYYLATHNLMETIQSAISKRNIRKALKSKLPEYMIPSVFSILPHFPLTFNGKIDWKALPPPKDFERLLERQFVAPRTETEKAILQIWCDILNLKQASMTDNFFDLGGNSLMVSQLSVQIMKQFNISVPVKVFIDLPFIPVIAEYIESKGKKYTFKSTIQEEIRHDAILNDDIYPTKKLGDLKHPGGILLTGVSGFLGIYLLRELLRSTEAKIYCLIRKGEFESAAKRLTNTIDQYNLSNEIVLSNRRIIILDGDIGNDCFGISMQQYQSLAEKIDTIYHCGAQVNTMASYTNLRSSNVQGTIEVIKFATHSIDKAIHYISTLSSAVKLDANGCYAEEFPDSETHNLVGGYAISKWVSERLLTQIKNRGLPVSIYRSGHIFGQMDTGITSMNNSLLYLIKGCLQLGIAPDWKENITFLPVDFASKATVTISLHHPESSAVYHLDSPHGIMWTDLIAWLQDRGYTINICSHQQWREQLTSVTPDNALYPFLPQYLAEVEPPNTPGTSIEHASSILKTIGLDFPIINDPLLQIYFNYLCDVKFIPTPDIQREMLAPILK